ncbi:ABC-2 type transport system ATP-binding protein [Seinonella peptonophila]|uniref:ABC-2 type transport system ATP-binding protein n=1 Tax=Seinonella peptonophila TaxID=112248 RepID=A0A1M5B0J8_9BACL|nr:ABC transporter ATP-binding protein [Seinonella peptonophila]SHF35970.1 ABC-2 type transport system ATP-binding protein [Seinonella peptonophila]
MHNIVEVKGLTKKYSDVTAVNQVEFQIEKDKIYGLLGKNGAGKTTIMQMLTGQIFPSHGEIKVFGESPIENQVVLNQICFIKESQKYPDVFRVIDVIETAASIFPNWDQEVADQLLEEFRLPLKKRMKKLSRGMFSSVGITIGLASRAPLTIFDEPYLGLDAVARNLFYNYLLEDYSAHPRTVILSTHLIDEVSKLLEHVIVIDQGEVLIDEETDQLHDYGYTLTGTKKQIESLIKEKNIITKSTLGTLTSVTIKGPLSKKEKEQIQELNLDLHTLSLQQLVVSLTSRKDGELK